MKMEERWWTSCPFPSFSAYLHTNFGALGFGRRYLWLVACNGKMVKVLDVMKAEHVLPVDILGSISFLKYEHKIDKGNGHLLIRDKPKEVNAEVAWIDYCPWAEYESESDFGGSVEKIDLSRKLSVNRVIRESPLDF